MSVFAFVRKKLRLLSRATRRLVRDVSFWGFAVLLAIPFALPPLASGFEIQTKDWRNVRQYDPAIGKQDRVATLAPGSVLDISDRYILRMDDGRIDTEASLNNWLRRAQNSPRKGIDPGSYITESGKQELFYPVVVKKAAPGSQNTDQLKRGQSYFVAFDSIASQQDRLTVTQTTPVYRTPPAPRPLPPSPPSPPRRAPPVHNPHPSETDSPCARGECNSAPQPFDQAISLLQQALAPIESLARRALSSTSGRTSRDLADIRDRFQRTCGVNLASFIPIVASQARAIGFAPESLLAMMTQESSGNCLLDHAEANGHSVGLFQVRSNRYPLCTPEELAAIQSTRDINDFRYQPRCLQNPLVNLSEAIHILAGKEAALTKATFYFPPIDYVTTDGFKATRHLTEPGFNSSLLISTNASPNRNLCSLVASAYNGGETWVFRAKRDVEIFNAKNHTHFKPENWDDLRVFYLRRHLNRYDGVQERLFGSVEFGREEHNSISNLTYTDNVCSPKGANGPSLRERWRAIIRSGV